MEENLGSRGNCGCEKFHMAEYNTLHGEIRELVAESRLLERQVIFASGAVWAWLATNTDSDSIPYFAWFIPLIFSTGGYIRATLLQKHVDSIASYIMKIERKLCPNEECWHGSKKQSGIRLSSKVFWVLLILVTIITPVVVQL